MKQCLRAAFAVPIICLAGGAAAQPAPIVVVENISIDFGFGALRIPRLEAIGANMDADELRAALTGRDGAPIHERLRKLEAAALSAPAIELEQNFAGSRQTTTYRQAHIEGLRNGRIERMFSASGSISGASEGEPYTGAHGPSVIEGVEFADALRILATGGAAGEKPATVYARFWMSDYRMEMPKFDLEMRDLTGGAVTLGPTSEPALEALQRLARLKPDSKDNDLEALKALSGLFAMFRASGVVESRVGLARMTSKDPAARFSGQARDLVMRDMRDGRIGLMAAVDIEGRGDRGGDFRMARIELAGFDIAASTDALIAIAREPARAESLNPAMVMPQFERFALRDLVVTTPNPARREDAAATARVSIGEMRIERAEAKAPEARVVRWSSAIERLRIASAKDDPRFEAQRAFGYENVDLSWSMATEWRPADSELALAEFALSGAGMGSASLKAKLGNVTEAIFTADRKVAALALLPVALKSAQLRLADAGLVDKYVAHEAKKRKLKPAQVRQRLAREVAEALKAPPDGPAAKQVAKALGDFLRDPKAALTINATAEPGISAIDAVSAKPPTGLWRRVKVETLRR